MGRGRRGRERRGRGEEGKGGGWEPREDGKGVGKGVEQGDDKHDVR